MAESMTEGRSLRGYVSCIKINGKPILPPLMTPERWAEMKRYKEAAVSVETTLSMKRSSVDSGVVLCPSSRSSSWGHRKSVDGTVDATPRNVCPSTSDEEAVLFEFVQKYSSPKAAYDSKKYHQTSPNVIATARKSTKEIVQASHFTGGASLPMTMSISEHHGPSTQHTHITETKSPSKSPVSHAVLHLSSNVQIQEQNPESGAKLVSSKATDSIRPPSSPQDKVNFGTISPVHRPLLQTASPIAESATPNRCSSQSAGQALIPVKKIHASLNILEIIAQDDIIQDGLGFKVWKTNCEVLKKRPQHSSTPANTTDENLSNKESSKVENLDESVSSIVVTASTDLNNYMNTSSSSKSSTSMQSLSSIAVLHELEITKQTTDNSYVRSQSSSNDESIKQMHIETEARRSISKNSSGPEFQDHADNLGIDGIKPLDLENEAKLCTAPSVEASSEVETVEKCRESHVKQSEISSDSLHPRLKRQHSYVLDSPSPLLVEHLKSCKYDGDMTASPTKKMLSSSECQQRRSLHGTECNSSLPNSSVTSPIKLQSPFASSDCLSSIVPKENIRTSNFGMSKNITRKDRSSSKENMRKSHRNSSETLAGLSVEETHSYGKKNVKKTSLVLSPRCNSFDSLSTAVSRKSSRTVMKYPKTPQKTPRASSIPKQIVMPRNDVKRVCGSQDVSTESLVQGTTPSGTPEKLSPQEELRALFLQLQIEHQKQMEELVEKQKREQEAMRKTFRQQQNQLMSDIRSLCPDVFSTPESHKLLSKSFTQPVNSDAAFGLKEIKHDQNAPNNISVDHQENVEQSPQEDRKNSDRHSVVYLDDAPVSRLQDISTSTSEVSETLGNYNISSSQAAHQNESVTSEHVDLSIVTSPAQSVNRNNAAQNTKENLADTSALNVHNTSTSIPETTSIQNTSSSNVISSDISDLSRAMTTETTSVEYSDSVVTSGASGGIVTQQMAYSVHTNGRVISKMHHLDEIALPGIQNISTSTQDSAEISKQVCRSKLRLTETEDRVTFTDAAGASDLSGNEVLYGLQTDGKIVSSVLTVSKSEVILSDGLSYSLPREETLKTAVFTQLNGVEHNGLVNTHFSTVMQGTRQSCSRELFPAYSRFGINYTKTHEMAASRIQAVIRGYLTRRLFRTARVQDLITTIRDTLLCAVQLSQECWPDVQPEDVELHRRLIQQVTAACYALHDVFFSLPISEQMAIIAGDRERQRSHAPRSSLPRPLSAATRRALDRKLRQGDDEEKPRNARSRRTWSSSCDNPSGSYGIARSCLLRQQQQQQMSSPQQQMVARARHSSTGAGRRPWR